MDALETVLAYHRRTKHHPQRYARSPGTMDWANQPDPFRRFPGARVVELPLASRDPELTWGGLFRGPAPPARPLGRESLGAFLELAVGLSAWKAHGASRWSLRMNPSSGNLHPTETYLLVTGAAELADGLYHYAPLEHALERRAGLPAAAAADLRAHFGAEGFLVGAASIFWRESWKYGERAFRYCQHDAGHALAALALSARLQGWRLRLLSGTADEETSALLGLDRTPFAPLEAEHPDWLAWVSLAGRAPARPDPPPGWASRLAASPLEGRPNTLSPQQVDWEVISRVAAAAAKPPEKPAADALPEIPAAPRAAGVEGLPAAAIIRRRRSAVAFQGRGAFPRESFLALLAQTLPGRGHPAFDLGLGPPGVHLALFVHRVEGLDPGLYLLLRRPEHREALRRAMAPGFAWEPAAAELPLFRLEAGDVRQEAAELSCHQSIASDGVFAAAMLAEFRPALADAPWRYRALHWETGLVGQVLYLAAEAHGLRGTGIGCYFDDPVHARLGLRDDVWQVLYHFTVGLPLEDPRVQTLPPYIHLDRRPG